MLDFSPESQWRPNQGWKEERDKLFPNAHVRPQQRGCGVAFSKTHFLECSQDTYSSLCARSCCCQVACRELGKGFQTSIPINSPAPNLHKGTQDHPQNGLLHGSPQWKRERPVEEWIQEMERRTGRRSGRNFKKSHLFLKRAPGWLS